MDREEELDLLERISERLGSADPASVGSAVARLLGQHMNEVEFWKGAWMGDLLHTRVQIDADAVHILAFVVWGKGGTTEQWMDPLHATFWRSGGRLTRYELRFCDQQTPSTPYRLHRKTEPSA